jgi:hypothetical protein
MKALDFTKKKSELVDKLVKLGFHYLSTDKEEPDGLRNPPTADNHMGERHEWRDPANHRYV